MAHPTKTKARKGSNGTGDSVTLYFDINDPAERKALNAARLLATKHGRRKQAIVALLEAVYMHYELTGELMSASAISSALIGQGSVKEDQPVSMLRSVDSTHGIKLENNQSKKIVVTADRAGAQNVAANFVNSMKGLASGFFD
jgi:hypothetical protein